MSTPRAAIFGCSGPVLTAEERAFFRDADPLGFILFARNIDTPDQVRALVDAFRESVGRDDAPVLIDQEGGRVQRLTPPHWRQAPAASKIAALEASDPSAGALAVRLNAQLIAAELVGLGITVDCVPVLDVPVAGASDVIGDRANGTDPAQIARLGRVICDAVMSMGVLPVIKHMPGHGRAMADSHHELPIVDAPHAELSATDFEPFAALRDEPWGMTAHVVYTAIDPARPATTSPKIIRDVIRGEIGFDGVLVSDDLSMNALAGSIGERAAAALAAGCDIALHCNGKMDEMTAVAEATTALSGAAMNRIDRAEQQRVSAMASQSTFDASAAVAQFGTLGL